MRILQALVLNAGITLPRGEGGEVVVRGSHWPHLPLVQEIHWISSVALGGGVPIPSHCLHHRTDKTKYRPLLPLPAQHTTCTKPTAGPSDGIRHVPGLANQTLSLSFSVFREQLLVSSEGTPPTATTSEGY